MNRYGRGGQGPSRATATTQCQKCLKRGHYSYECKAVVQDRPYTSRPSRTQQLLNPKLVPKLNSDVPQDLLRKKGVADEQLAKAEQERGRKRDRQIEDSEGRDDSKRMRSTSSDSVSTISTKSSRSPPPHRSARESSFKRSLSRPRSGSVSPHRGTSGIERKRQRGSSVSSSAGSYISQTQPEDRKEPDVRRSTRRRYSSQSPEARGRMTRSKSRSPVRERRRLSNDRRQDNGRGPPLNKHNNGNGSGAMQNTARQSGLVRERSLSPFSKRLALTHAMSRN
ncbi:hypothetical protein BP6252_12331 [Coleophoma cylindrospora]|uniref:Zinc knuckle-domain-containing protein n=1 Tax=Coleophoma cylindrospora TaxID=1849047 RepID=A0A3D8QGX8_9HELO|nr:hypothetical protein BP6252_12331 [Coleophoma cylindrospora]